MPWIVYRQVMFDCLRLTVLGTAILSLLVALALAIEPMASGMLSPTDLLRFVIYSAPTLVGFTLPFCAAFAATMVFVRMSSDSEIMALSAAGVDYLRILLPVIILGVVLSSTLLFLSNSLVPRYFRAAAELVQRDMAKILLRRVATREPLRLGNLIIYADQAREIPRGQWPQREEDHEPIQWLSLDGVAIGEVDPRSGRLRSDFTAASADLLFYDVDDRSWVSILWRDAAVFQVDTGMSGFTRESTLWASLDRPWRERAEFLTYTQLRGYRRSPERFGAVRAAQRSLIARIRQVHTLQEIERRIDEGRFLSLRQSFDSDVEYHIHARRYERDTGGTVLRAMAEGDEAIWVHLRRAGRQERYWRARQALLNVIDDRGEPRIVVTLAGDVTIRDWQMDTTTERPQVELPRTVWPHPLPRHVEQLELDALIEHAGTAYPQYDAIGAELDRLNRELMILDQRTLMMLHYRAVGAVGGGLLLIFTAILAIRLRGQMPLVVYLLAFLAALMLVMISEAGKTASVNPARLNASAVGIPILWSGVLGLAAVSVLLYRRIIRH
ncbi:MAG: LptF/LptG family permease [Phycisphaeraceae bacterium]|nr:LptF/LptG family permease [Phycisphaeraceae bacterium]